jgi:N-acetylglucosaminyl-diphospho-decaprenol L-rhamnosyltransferase
LSDEIRDRVDAVPVTGLTSVIVVAADSGGDLEDCARRVLASAVPVELIISDNASRDGSIETVAAVAPGDSRLRIVRNGTNLGFAAACNRGAAIARGDMLLFLNPDCRVEPQTLARLRAAIEGDVRAGVVGACVIGADGAYEPASRRRDPVLRRAVATMSGLARLEARWPALAGANLPACHDAPALEQVDAVSGALMLVRRTAFSSIGGFDEGYFLHCEDLDLCRRTRDAGAQVVCANDVRVVHVKGTSSRSRPFLVALSKHRGMWRWFRKFDPAARNPVVRLLVWCGLWAHFALASPLYAWRWLSARL